jgi:tetratricopeptide (TPR) repeat protein
LHELSEDWKAANQARTKVLELRTKTLPKDHWQVADARWAIDNLETLAKLSEAGRRRLAEADRLIQQVLELSAQGKYIEALGLVRQALSVREELLGERHPDLAASLNSLGYLLRNQGNYGEAQGYFQRALEMRLALYPRERYPHGHPYLAFSLNNLGMVLRDQGNYGEARGYLRRALEMNQALYPKEQYPQGHPDLASSLHNLGSLLLAQGNHGEAREFLKWALEMNQALYPKEQYPHGHPDLASSLHKLGMLLHHQGNYGEARGYYQRALEMRQGLYPKERYPHGHPDLATSLNNLGVLLQNQGNSGEARGYYQQALEMRQALYSKERYPQGHPDLAVTLDSLGLLLHHQGNSGEARGYYQQALEMFQRLYPRERYPHGHPDLAISLNNLGGLLDSQGNYAEALGYYQRALEMEQALYPQPLYPWGHPDLAVSLNNLGALYHAEGEHTEAWPYLSSASDMVQGLTEIFLAAASEAEALDYLYLARLPASRDLLISTSLHLPDSAEAAYTRVWRGKAAIARTLERRQASLFNLADTHPATRQTIETWRDRRRQLARLLLAPSDGRDHPDRLRPLQELTADKERLERQLAEAIPEFARQQRLNQSSHSRLLEVLPDRTVVLDLVWFTRFEQDSQVKGKKGRRWTPSYVGFVLAKGRPVERIDLGPARPIDEAVAQWRAAIVARRPSPAAESLRRLVWEPLARQFLPGTETVFIAPDGALTALPWAALPGDRPGTVLLEQYALATVPHAPFLLDRLTAPPRSQDDDGTVLALGGVAYDRAPRPVEDQKTKLELLAVRQAETERGRGDGWKDLPGTAQELNSVARLAAPRRVV